VWDIGAGSDFWGIARRSCAVAPKGLGADLAPIKEKVKNRKPSTETEIKRLQTHAQSAIETKGEPANVNSAYLASNALPELIVS
jgi:hypothetical protein